MRHTDTRSRATAPAGAVQTAGVQAASASIAHAAPATTTVAAAVPALPAISTIVFGLLVLFVVGFLQTPAVHNGAHDTRHANGFPCH